MLSKIYLNNSIIDNSINIETFFYVYFTDYITNFILNKFSIYIYMEIQDNIYKEDWKREFSINV